MLKNFKNLKQFEQKIYEMSNLEIKIKLIFFLKNMKLKNWQSSNNLNFIKILNFFKFFNFFRFFKITNFFNFKFFSIFNFIFLF